MNPSDRRVSTPAAAFATRAFADLTRDRVFVAAEALFPPFFRDFVGVLALVVDLVLVFATIHPCTRASTLAERC